jgi:Pyridoxamine 5'-phosphate oxidase
LSELPWAEIAERFDAAQNWWVATSGPAGPHTVPVWGVVVDAALHFYGEDSTVRSRNLLADPRLVLHLESGADVLIVHGTATRGEASGAYPAVGAAYAAKYSDPGDAEYLPDAPGMTGAMLWTVVPERAIAWTLGTSDEWDNRRWRAGSA